MKYKIKVSETLSQVVEIDAKDKKSALEKIKKNVF